jgi:hypothetical protein
MTVVNDEMYNRCLAHHAGVRNLEYVVSESIPIPYFGDVRAFLDSKLRVFTAALNPSDREFPVRDPRFDVPNGLRGPLQLEAELCKRSREQQALVLLEGLQDLQRKVPRLGRDLPPGYCRARHSGSFRLETAGRGFRSTIGYRRYLKATRISRSNRSLISLRITPRYFVRFVLAARRTGQPVGTSILQPRRLDVEELAGRIG